MRPVWMLGLLAVAAVLGGCAERLLTPTWVYDDGDRVGKLVLEPSSREYSAWSFWVLGRAGDGQAYAFDGLAEATLDGAPWQNRTLAATGFGLARDGSGYAYEWPLTGVRRGHHDLLLRVTMAKTGAALEGALAFEGGDPFFRRER